MQIKTVKDIIKDVDTKSLLSYPISEWRILLASECGVYVFGTGFLAKRFDQINYVFCNKNEAKEILIDNLYALLRFKYFKKPTEESDERIKEIVNNVATNIKSTLKKVSFDKDADCNVVRFLPDGCIAFRNGVYDFINNRWLFKYDVIEIEYLQNKIYMYDPNYIILWYVDIDFIPLDIAPTNLSLEDFIEYEKLQTQVKKNYCFELMYNMAHDRYDKFSMVMFKHLCEILGYTLLQSFNQHFVLFIGSGQNGKNSLFDGCFTHKLVPRPAANDMDSIENDRFITGALENKSHNIFLESSAKLYIESKMIKALTGSMYQTIEQKGVNKYSSLINCKYIFAANDQDKVKFSDTTTGFRRRINMFEIFYKWDAQGRYLKTGDYYDIAFSNNLDELKNDNNNLITFIYFGIYGMLSATSNFSKAFEFTTNDWKLAYTDADLGLKSQLTTLHIKTIVAYMKKNYNDCKVLFYDEHRIRLYNSKSMNDIGINDYDKMISMFENDMDLFTAYFSEYDVYMNIKILRQILSIASTLTSFTQNLKKLYGIENFVSCYNNQAYIKVGFDGEFLKVRDVK